MRIMYTSVIDETETVLFKEEHISKDNQLDTDISIYMPQPERVSFFTLSFLFPDEKRRRESHPILLQTVQLQVQRPPRERDAS